MWVGYGIAIGSMLLKVTKLFVNFLGVENNATTTCIYNLLFGSVRFELKDRLKIMMSCGL